VSATDVVGHAGGDKVEVGAVSVQLVHTPGHTPGANVLSGPMLVSGDTLFLGGCGRTDLPGSDPEEMYHRCAVGRATDGTACSPVTVTRRPRRPASRAVRDMNMVFKPTSEAQWLAMFGRRTGVPLLVFADLALRDGAAVHLVVFGEMQ